MKELCGKSHALACFLKKFKSKFINNILKEDIDLRNNLVIFKIYYFIISIIPLII